MMVGLAIVLMIIVLKVMELLEEKLGGSLESLISNIHERGFCSLDFVEPEKFSVEIVICIVNILTGLFRFLIMSILILGIN